MQATKINGDLSLALNYLEEIINREDGKAVIDSIKKYKAAKQAGSSKLKTFEAGY